jgi:hypothetical protein
MFQPELGQPRDEWDIKHNVLKEYGEELFDLELDKHSLDARYFYSQWGSKPESHCVRELLEELQKGLCTFKTTGLIVNLMNLRPEVCTLLLVKDAEWWEIQRRLMKRNWEYLTLQEIWNERDRALTDLRLDQFENEFLDYFGCASGDWTVPGLATLLLGVEAARKELRS